MIPDAAFLRQRDGELRFRHRIHRRRKQRDIQLDLPSQMRARISISGDEISTGGDQQYIIECDRITDDLGVCHVQLLHLRCGGVK